MFASEDYYIGFYWGCRRETAGDCALRTFRFLDELKNLDPAFGRWYEARGIHTEPARDVQSVTRMFQGIDSSCSVADAADSDELGFMLPLVNSGPSANSVKVRITCGGYSEWVPNNCVVMYPPQDDTAKQRFMKIGFLRSILEVGIRCWKPEFAVVTSHEIERILGDNDAHIKIGWLTYVSHSTADIHDLSEFMDLVEVDGHGYLVIAKDLPISLSDSDALARLRQASIRIAKKIKRCE
jgi:hypothetical protein